MALSKKEMDQITNDALFNIEVFNSMDKAREKINKFIKTKKIDKDSVFKRLKNKKGTEDQISPTGKIIGPRMRA